MVHDVLSELPPLRNDKGSFFDVDMVGDTICSTVFVSIDSRYYGTSKQNCSRCIVDFTYFCQGGRL